MHLVTYDLSPPKFIFTKPLPKKVIKCKATCCSKSHHREVPPGESNMASSVERERLARAEIFLSTECQEMGVILHAIRHVSHLEQFNWKLVSGDLNIPKAGELTLCSKQTQDRLACPFYCLKQGQFQPGFPTFP